MNDFVFKWYNKELKVKFIKNCPEFQLLTIKIGPYKKDDVVKIPFWITKHLWREGYIQNSGFNSYDIEELLVFLWKEKDNSMLQSIDKDFYLRTRETITNLLNELNNQKNMIINTQLLQKKEKMETTYKDIFLKRLYKILRIAIMSSDQSRFLNNCTNEEIQLYTRLREIIKNWVNYVGLGS